MGIRSRLFPPGASESSAVSLARHIRELAKLGPARAAGRTRRNRSELSCEPGKRWLRHRRLVQFPFRGPTRYSSASILEPSCAATAGTSRRRKPELDRTRFIAHLRKLIVRSGMMGSPLLNAAVPRGVCRCRCPPAVVTLFTHGFRRNRAHAENAQTALRRLSSHHESVNVTRRLRTTSTVLYVRHCSDPTQKCSVLVAAHSLADCPRSIGALGGSERRSCGDAPGRPRRLCCRQDSAM